MEKSEKRIMIVGVGNIGSRHLQALKAINIPLDIFVIDPNPDSLKQAKEMYDSMPSNKQIHEVTYTSSIKKLGQEIDIAIIATNSDIRRKVIEKLIEFNQVNNFLLEKLLFQKVEDYHFIKDLLKINNCRAWVNCNRRITPTYNNKIKNWFNKKKLFYYNISGSLYGLMTNVIHEIDYMTYLLESNDFYVDTTYLDSKLIQSKRKGFLEMTGILQIHFKNGSHGFFARYPSGRLSEMTIIESDTDRCIINLIEEVSWIKNIQKLGWKTFNAMLTYQSELTTTIIENILNKDKSYLPSYKNSMTIHLKLLEPILEFINKNSFQKFDIFPFT